jgi:hypothetical protein
MPMMRLVISRALLGKNGLPKRASLGVAYQALIAVTLSQYIAMQLKSQNVTASGFPRDARNSAIAQTGPLRMQKSCRSRIIAQRYL